MSENRLFALGLAAIIVLAPIVAGFALWAFQWGVWAFTNLLPWPVFS